MKRVILKAYAKINLYLEITGLLGNGYHAIDSVMQSVDLSDIVMLSKSPAPGIRLSCSRPGVPADSRNTAFKATEAFMRANGVLRAGVAIYIDKKIPTQAGLGGGSADAAAVLTGLNALFDTGLSAGELCVIGAEIGADVPFCVTGGTMLARGMGEKLTVLNPPGECRFIIIKPPGGTDTAEAYKKYDALNGNLPKADIRPMLKAIESGVSGRIADNLYNVFERVCENEVVHAAKEALLKSGALGAVMTGSGNAVIGLFDAFNAAEAGGAPLLQALSFEDGCSETFAAKPVPYGNEIIYTE